MKTIKNAVAVAAIAILSTGLFAQTLDGYLTRDVKPQSKTNVATAEVFGNDVDNYTNVTKWTEVQPKDFFAYFGMGALGQPSYDLGFAKQFKKVYWGTYVSTNFGTLESKASDKTKTTTTGNTEFDFVNLIGFGKIGVSLDIYYKDNGSTTSIGENFATISTDKTWFTALSAGLSEYKLGKTLFAPYATIALGTSGKYVANTVVDNITYNDNRVFDFAAKVGSGIELSKKGGIEQSLDVAFGFENFSAMAEGADSSSTFVLLPVEYSLEMHPVKNFGFGVKAVVTPTFGFAGDSYSFGFGPSLAAGIQYDTQKKVILNAGIDFAIPAYSYSSTTVKIGDNSVKSSTANWDGNDANLTFSSGFTFVPTKGVNIDCSWAIIDHLFQNTETKLNEGFADFWSTVNQVLIHNIGFEVSVKF